MSPSLRPVVRLRPREHKRLVAGHPWAYSNEVVMDAAAKSLAPGTLVTLARDDGAALGVALFNPHTLIAARLLDRDAAAAIDTNWLAHHLGRALALRETLFERPFYRLVHAEADGLPGLVIDRYGEIVVMSLNTAGMAQLAPLLEEAIRTVLGPRVLIEASDSPARRLEGLEPQMRIVWGTLDGSVPVEENALVYRADLTAGQKTGWFFDQRDNRRFAARLSRGARVLDVYSYSGGFALACAKGGAASVLAVDRSKAALALAEAAAAANGLAAPCRFEAGEAFETLARLAADGARFDLVIADPPAFAKSRKDVGPALKGYRKLARLCAAVTAPRGFLVLASCSHHITAEALLAEAQHALCEGGRAARLIHTAGAGPDHPVHPALPESAYLKALFFSLD